MRLNKRNRAPALAAAVCALAAAPAAMAADIVISQGAGFDDPSPATPIGGNAGTTVGEQRLIAFEFAASLWGAILESDVQIVVASSFAPQTCNAQGGVLGGASPQFIESDFPGAPIPNTWYFSALANSLAGTDLNPGGQDINATFNASIDNNDDCLAGSNWYYGLDNNPSGGDIDFLNVVMHEIGHGLGSASVVSVSNGTLPSNRPDIYSRFAFDTDLNLHFDEMTNAQRQASVINTGSVVWDGPLVTAAAPAILAGSLIGEITNPALGEVEIQTAAFGPAVPSSGLSGNVVLIDDGTGTGTDGCEPLTATSAAAVAGNIAFIDRGNCNFTVKTVNAQNAGAVGVIIANNAADGLPPLGGNQAGITIPTVGVTLADGNAIRNELPGVTIDLAFDDSRLAGANNNGQVRLFSPNPVQPGSSFSHWDTTASPNLLMEPSITATLESRNNVDLTVALYADEGWGIVDEDGDLIPDVNDNCRLVSNTDQRDSNGDGFGNVCDADLNNDGIINVVDLGLLRAVFFTSDQDADLNGDGVVNVVDLGIMRASFFGAPGPSSLAP
ncbi:MAG: PA domain-containing protein [Gammaproteobacteria bacterium]